MRYLLSGALAFVLDYTVFFVGYAVFGVDYLWANGAGFLAGFVASFTLNRRFTFGSNERVGGSLIRYVALALFSLTAGSALMHVFVEWFAIVPAVAKVLVVICTVCWNFPLYRYLVFRGAAA